MIWKNLNGGSGGTLIGDYIGHFSGRDLSLVEEKALYHGLQALLETGIINQ